MRAEPWFPIGHRPAESLSLRALRHAGPGWQIYEADGPRRVLFASPSLAQSWIGSGLLPEGLLKAVEFGDATYRFLASPAGFLLAPIDALARPDTKADGLAFAIALKESRRRAGEAVSFHDALYVEQHSRLLPTFSVSPRVDDSYVLGTWLSSGVHVSTESARRLASLTGWMPRSALREIIQAAGLEKARSLEGEAKEDARVERALVEEEGAETERRGEKRGPFRLPGRPELERFFNEHIIDIALHPEKYQALGIHFPPSVVLEGPPGCGKTFAVERLGEYLDWPVYHMDAEQVGSPYIHETSRKIAQLFDKAMDNAPSMIVIDEMEAFLADRGAGLGGSTHRLEEVGEFLRRIPEANQKRVLVIGMTNRIDLIDQAVIRRGRFDHVIRVGLPSREELGHLLDALLSKLPRADDLRRDEALDALTGRPLSDAAFVVREAARLAARDSKKEVDNPSLQRALASLPREESSRAIGFGRRERNEQP